MRGPWALPQTDRFVLVGAAIPASWAPKDAQRVSEGLARVDLLIADGVFQAVAAYGQLETDAVSVALNGCIVLPGFVDMHTHLDKGHIWARTPNSDGSFGGALAAVDDDRTQYWRGDDLYARMEFSLRCAYAHGTSVIRTHLDSLPPHHELSWDVFDTMLARWADRITLQACSLFTFDLMDQPELAERIAQRTAQSGGILGGVTFPMPDLDARLERLFRLAAEYGLDIDLHVDETLDPSVLTLEQVADTALATGFTGKVIAGHCCSLSVQNEATVSRVIDKLLRARIAIVSLPMCNLYLQDRGKGRTPRRRGVTLLSELRSAGVPVAVASDNARDPFYAYGDLDPLEVLRESVRAAHLDHPVGDAPLLVTQSPADMIGLPHDGRIAPGTKADLIIFRARSLNELLSRPHADRLVLRGGRMSDAVLPDYAELDVLMGMSNA